MKIEELSVGDWVRCKQFAQKHKIEETHPCKVVKLEDFVWDCCVWLRAVTTFQDGKFLKYKSHIDHESIPAKHLTPIPLTPEILEKNGFVDVGGGVFNYDTIDLFCEDDKLYFAREAGYDKLLQVQHVHQLQHALRLAGIDKEIEL